MISLPFVKVKIKEKSYSRRLCPTFNILNYNMFYKSIFIHKNRIFAYFQNKVKNLNNILIMIMKIKRNNNSDKNE